MLPLARILIVTAWYYPFIHPRAHRWTSLAEYWAAQGHEVDVLTSRRRDCPRTSVLNGVRVWRTGFDSLKEWYYFWNGDVRGRGRVGASVRRPGFRTRLLGWVYARIWKNLYFPDDAALWYFPARRLMFRLLRQKKADVLVTVSLPFTGQVLGRAAKRVFPNLHWLADMGDPFSIQAHPLNNSWLYGTWSRRLEQEVLVKSDACVVTHSAARAAYLEHFGAMAEKLAVAPPLLHPLPQRSETVSGSKKPATQLGYFGALYAPVRRPEAFLQLFEHCRAFRPEGQNPLEAHFYGDIFPEFYAQLTAVEGVFLHGLQSRQVVRAAMQEVDVLVNIGNTTNYQLPSKVVDYLAAGKPVVHLSFVEPDPFVIAWGNAPGLLVVRVPPGGFSPPEIQRCLDFFENLPECLTGETLRAYVQPFTLEAVAKKYTALIPALQVVESSAAVAESPGHR